MEYTKKQILLTNKKSISALIATVLLIVVAVVLIAVILTWSKSFATNNLNTSSYINYDKSDLIGQIDVSKILPSNDADLLENNKVILKNKNAFTDVNIIGYKIISDTNEDYNFINTSIELDAPIILNKNSASAIDIPCFPTKKITLQLYTSDEEYINVPVYKPDSGVGECEVYDLKLNKIISNWDFNEGSGLLLEDKKGSNDCTLTGTTSENFWINGVGIGTFDENTIANCGNDSSLNLDNNFSLEVDFESTDYSDYVIQSISIGTSGYKSHLLLDNGELYYWGGQYDYPIFEMDTNFVKITGPYSDGSVWCGITNVGGLKCWGSNNYGAVGNGGWNWVDTPVDVNFLSSGVSDVDQGRFHVCALLIDGTVKCWGTNWNGELGNGTTTQSNVPVDVLEVTDAINISVGYSHTCVVISGGEVKCWGNNGNGELGDGTQTDRSTPITVSGITNATQVSVGISHSCALLSDGTVKCWGWNQYSGLGDGTITNSYIPVSALGLTDVVRLYVSDYSSCAVLSSGVIKCWGRNNYGQLGDGTKVDKNIPTLVNNFSRPDQIYVSEYSTCFLIQNTLKCIGGDHVQSALYGDNFSAATKKIPAYISSITDVDELVSSGYETTCYLVDGGTKCFNWSYSGVVPAPSDSSIPVTPTGLDADVSKVSCGMQFCCALITDGTVKCWGGNGSGQQGNGTLDTVLTPTEVSGLSNIIDVETGISHTCVLISDGTVKCFGDNEYNGIGVANTVYCTMWGGYCIKTPTLVSGLSGVTKLSLGYKHSCALLSNGTIKCWGYNVYGQLGDGTTTNRITPVLVSGISNATKISVGSFYSCAILDDNTVKCWGKNSFGELGDGTTSNRLTPVSVSGLSDVNDLISNKSSNYESTCAILINKTMKCWGRNYSGQLGDGTTTDSYVPVNVLGLTDIVSASLNYGLLFAVDSNQHLYSWGSGSYISWDMPSVQPSYGVLFGNNFINKNFNYLITQSMGQKVLSNYVNENVVLHSPLQSAIQQYILSYDGNNLSTYNNGVLTSTKSFPVYFNLDSNLIIGNGFTGKITSIKIYDQAMTPYLATQLYQANSQKQ